MSKAPKIAPAYAAEAKGARMHRRLEALRGERASWMSHWKDINGVLLPRTGRFFSSDVNRGDKKHQNILDNTAVRALRILAAGMLSGMTSPARPWFRLALADRSMMEYQPVKVWLEDARSLMLDIFQRSNTYRALHQHYLHLGAFGTSASFIADNPDSLIHHFVMPVGQYLVSTDAFGKPNTLFREFRYTVAQAVGEFGLANVSPQIADMFKRGALDQWVEIVHQVEPRADYIPDSPLTSQMPFSSCYWHKGYKERPMRESGFKRFRALVARWEVEGGDIYGSSCPGMDALGDIRQLQHEQLRKANAIDYQTKPPLQMPTSMKNQEVETLPGGITYVDGVGNQKIESLFNVNLDLNHLLGDIQDVRGRIQSAFYADLFLMMADTGKQMTATEVAERHEEKLLALGPVLERLHDELLRPLIDVTFEKIIEAGILPPPPPELEGVELDVEFISVLAQAQRAVSTQSLDRFFGTVGLLAKFKPEVLDKLDADQAVDEYADALGVNPRVVVPDDVVAASRQQRQQQQQAMAQAEQAKMMAESVGKLGGVETQGGQSNAGNDILSLFQGYNSPSAESY